MSNIYRYQFVSNCPNNDRPIIYSMEIETDEVIHVEHIITAAVLQKTAYHEEIADQMHERFKGRQVIKAHHHGVDIETRRGFEPDPCGCLTERVQIGKKVFEKGVEAVHAIRAASR
ncbi:hypothetical protein [Burkholderia gladioli]|uniref:hypothetical protein n=1 Tax=Burkholderia gladioli TaxID=28095 RepID=UPI001640BFC4|nr:hypothetical protein [Burkholderia gladioli]